MLERFAHFLLKRNRNAILVAFLCSVLPVFFESVSIVIVALVTLRKGGREGFLVLAWGILPLLARAFVEKSYLFFIVTVLAFLIVWAMAVLLRRYASWSLLLEGSALLAMIIVLLTLIFRDSVILWWTDHISAYMQLIVQAGYLQADEVLSRAQVLVVAKVATGFEAFLLFLMASFKLAIARWWEGRVFKEIGFKKELLHVHFDRLALLLFVGLVLAAILSKEMVFVEAVIPLTGLYVIAGFSMLHYWMQGYKYARSALFGFYVVVMLFPYALALPLLLGLVDSGLNLRMKMLKKEV